MKRLFVILSGIVCFSVIGYSDQSGSLVVSPGSDVSWGCVLKPYETATLTITVAAPPPGYRLKSKTVAITSSSPDFCWGGGYSVVNSALTSAVTRVTVSCVWEPIPGEGGGPGTPPPNLYGSATGIASAQPGEYWNVADTHVLAVGNSVSVRAYKNDNEPAPSAWSISGPATIAGAGASATVAGTAPSASEFDVIVHSVCNETGQSDDELLTVVGVKSIEVDPDVVCVGNANVSYEITTQPEGYNYMVSYTPADTSTPGVKEVIATCGTSAATCSVIVVGFSGGTLSVEGGGNMRFYPSILGGDTVLNAETDNPPFPGAYFDGTGTTVPEGVTFNWRLSLKQYNTRTIVGMSNGVIIGTETTSGWDGGEEYAGTSFTITGTGEIHANDSPSQSYNVTKMYHDGVRSATFTDEFDLYLYGKICSNKILLDTQNWGWSFSFTLSTNAVGEVEYTVTSKDEIP